MYIMALNHSCIYMQSISIGSTIDVSALEVDTF